MSTLSLRSSWRWGAALSFALASWSPFALAEPTSAPASASTSEPTAVSADVEARAKALEVQLMAPCCDHQTLDVHRSPPANAMREEIRARLAAGDSEESILRAFEQRYGPEILAVQSADTANILGGVLLLLSAAGAAFAAVALRRWRRRSDQRIEDAAKASTGTQSKKPDLVWDQRLDSELAALDD